MLPPARCDIFEFCGSRLISARDRLLVATFRILRLAFLLSRDVTAIAVLHRLCDRYGEMTAKAVLDGVLHSFGVGATGFAFFSAADFDDGTWEEEETLCFALSYTAVLSSHSSSSSSSSAIDGM